MIYIVTVTCPVDEDDFAPFYKFFSTLEEAKRYKKMADDESDSFVICEIYEANRIA